MTEAELIEAVYPVAYEAWVREYCFRKVIVAILRKLREIKERGAKA